MPPAFVWTLEARARPTHTPAPQSRRNQTWRTLGEPRDSTTRPRRPWRLRLPPAPPTRVCSPRASRSSMQYLLTNQAAKGDTKQRLARADDLIDANGGCAGQSTAAPQALNFTAGPQTGLATPNAAPPRSEEHTSELQSRFGISYAVL